MSDPTFWKRKLAALLHDPPSKALDIKNHGERSDAAFRSAGFIDTEVGDYLKQADHIGAAADRLPFPASQSSGLRCAFDGMRNGFLHPLDGTKKLAFHAEFKSAEQGIEGEASVQPVLTAESLAGLPSESERWRARYFAHWRLWPQHAAEKDYRLALLPADTRIPDHTIWTHMQVVSALDGCTENGVLRPAFLKFQLGPVQDFIAAARSIRDLWSGSYLLSWLMAAGMKALSAEDRTGCGALPKSARPTAVRPALARRPMGQGKHWYGYGLGIVGQSQFADPQPAQRVFSRGSGQPCRRTCGNSEASR